MQKNLRTQDLFKDTKTFLDYYEDFMELEYAKSLEQSDIVEKYMVLAEMIKAYTTSYLKETRNTVRTEHKKQVYYFSLEFLLGRSLTNNMMSLGIYDVIRDGLNQIGIDINRVEDVETDAGLGNGGLGRLAACFIDSMAALRYPGNGNTIRYRNGLFKQLIKNNEQIEVPDLWLKIGNPWETRKPDKAVTVRFYGDIDVYRNESGNLAFHHKNTVNILAVPYDMPVVGANGGAVNTLRMWSPEPSDDMPHSIDYRSYLTDVDDVCLNLYPDDSTEKGRYLRIKQEYFFVAAGLSSIINDYFKSNDSLDNFADKVVIQLNDTHPALAIPEMMRILMDQFGLPWANAWAIVTKTFAYTNHTVLSEALEKWPVTYIKTLLPRIYMIIEEIDRQFRNSLLASGKDKYFVDSVSIIHDNSVRMANLCIVGSFSVNGVAKLHSEILKNECFKDFYSLFPEKFSNKTNGITQRRWLLYSNPELTSLIEKYIGPEFKTDFSKIEDLMQHVDNPDLQREFLDIKKARKHALANYLYKRDNIVLDCNSIFDVQAKRLHAYKRQLLNIMYVISLYQRIKSDPSFTMPKTTFIFGAKAASAYFFAKKVIKLINCVSEVIRKDEQASKFIDVVFIPNYCVSVAEYLMNAADVSEQISTAGKEASGTGNMKFMMNGAITLGTMDGANVEIYDLVGEDNIVIFGQSAQEVAENKKNYNAYSFYQNNERIRKVIDSLTDGTWSADKNDFTDIANEFLLRNDEYMLLADFDSYCAAHDKINALYANEHDWAKKCLINIAKSAYFSSDRTIEEYAHDIWHLEKI